jgi:hypothetical protein
MTRKTALLISCKHAAAAACVLLILSLLSCNSCRHKETGEVSPGRVSPGEEPTSGGWMDAPKLTNAAKVYDVTYTPETVLFSPKAVASSLKKVSADGVTYTFDASSSDAKKLHAGSVMLLSDLALARVTSATPTGDLLVVQTEPAALTDAIANGRIEATKRVDFAALQSAYLKPPEGFWPHVPTVYAQTGGTPFSAGPLKLSMTIDPFSYSIAFTPAAGQVNVEMSISDSTANLLFKATGYMKNYDSIMNIAISNQKVTKLDFDNSGLDCDLTITWSAASAVAGPMNKISSWTEKLKEYPGLKNLAATLPFAIGPIPFTLKFTTGIIFTPAFTSKNTLMTGSIKVHYSGSAGFTVDRGTTQPTGTITEPNQKGPLSQIMSLGPIGFMVGVEFPRIELGMGLGLVTFSPAAFLSPVSSLGIVYGGPAAMLPCETHILDVTVNAGITAKSTVWSFFGAAAKLEFSKQVYKKNYTGPKAGMMPCPK